MRNLPRWVPWALAGAGYLAAFTFIASITFLYPSGLWRVYSGPSWPVAWWLYLFELGDNPIVHKWLIVSAIPAGVLPLLLIIFVWHSRRSIQARYTLQRLPPARPWSPHEKLPTHGNARRVDDRDIAGRMRR